MLTNLLIVLDELLPILHVKASLTHLVHYDAENFGNSLRYFNLGLALGIEVVEHTWDELLLDFLFC